MVFQPISSVVYLPSRPIEVDPSSQEVVALVHIYAPHWHHFKLLVGLEEDRGCCKCGSSLVGRYYC